jgi:hypothetical protein
MGKNLTMLRWPFHSFGNDWTTFQVIATRRRRVCMIAPITNSNANAGSWSGGMPERPTSGKKPTKMRTRDEDALHINRWLVAQACGLVMRGFTRGTFKLGQTHIQISNRRLLTSYSLDTALVNALDVEYQLPITHSERHPPADPFSNSMGFPRNRYRRVCV